MPSRLTSEQIEEFVSRTSSTTAKVIWNAAIEVAALKSEKICGHDSGIRGLKK